jgi:hypothetical protein
VVHRSPSRAALSQRMHNVDSGKVGVPGQLDEVEDVVDP